MRGRGKKTVINTIASLVLEVVAIISGMILPRLIMSELGSAYNGLTSSISQFLGCAVLLRAGIGGATRAALYKPLQAGDKDAVNSIMSATVKFMRKIAFILIGLICVLACTYPFIVHEEFDWLFTFSLILIMGISTFLESFLGLSNYMLLQADQKYYIPSIIHIITYILNTIVAVILLTAGCGIHMIKLGSAMVFALYPILLSIYVKRNYNLDLSVPPDYSAVSQRWDAFFHQVAAFVMSNTDVVVLTLFCPIEIVSVYAVYNMIISAIKKLIKSFTNGLEAAFGNMIAAGENRILKRNFMIVESLIYDISTFVTVCSGILIVPFVMVYTSGIKDANYYQLPFALVIVIAQFFNSVRQPYQLVVQAAGHYKQTKLGAVIEPIINISLSVLGVIKFGLIGVAMGTLVATLFRTIQYSVYVTKNLIKNSYISMLINLAISTIECVVVIVIYNLLSLPAISTFGGWILHAIVVAIICIIVILLADLIFKRETTIKLVSTITRQFKKKRSM